MLFRHDDDGKPANSMISTSGNKFGMEPMQLAEAEPSYDFQLSKIMGDQSIAWVDRYEGNFRTIHVCSMHEFYFEDENKCMPCVDSRGKK
mgnify:CR=1 FL=1